jgi:alpha-glucosidase
MPEHPELENVETHWHSPEAGRAIAENNAIITAYDKQYGTLPPDNTLPWQTPGAVQSFQKTQQGLVLQCENALVECVWLTADMLRVRLQASSENFSGEPISYAVIKTDWTPVALYVAESREAITVHIENYVYIIHKAAFALELRTEDDHILYQDGAGVGWRSDGVSRLSLSLAADEASYGTGERSFPLNLRGRKLALWNKDAGNYTYGFEPINYCVPFYLGVHHQGLYGVFWDNPARGSLDIGAAHADELVFTSELGAITYYLFAGTTANQILGRYTELTGRMPLPPLWALGYHQARYSYFPAEDVLATARQFREKQIPCDAIYLDIHYMDEYRIFTWDKKGFPDFVGTIAELHQMGFKVVAILDPGVKVDPNYAVYQSGIEHNVFVKYPDGKIAAGVVWPGLCHFPDFTSAAVREWWAKQVESLLATGLDGLWNDMNEPLYFSANDAIDPPDYLHHDNDGRGGTHRELHNIYGMQMARATRMALEKQRAGLRQLNITRAGYAGTQRLASSWTGDNRSNWDGLRLSVSMVINMALSGQSFTGPDIGGFAQDATGELVARWTQAGVLFPFFRNHSAVDTLRQDPWQFGEPYTSVCRAAIELRYQLLPYLYSAFAECHFYGYPIIRPLWTAEPENPQLRSIDDCYFVGDSVLVAPVLYEFALRRTVYLPAGDWYDFWTNDRYTGGQIISIEAPLDRVPLFIKSGMALPMIPVMQHTGEKPIDKLILRIYTDSGETRLYEDAGEGLGYEQGEYRWMHIVCTETANTMTIERDIEGAYQPTYSQIELQTVGFRTAPVSVLVDGQHAEKWSFINGMLTVTVGEFNTVLIVTE